jgi:hypothetical protein
MEHKSRRTLECEHRDVYVTALVTFQVYFALLLLLTPSPYVWVTLVATPKFNVLQKATETCC